MTNRVYVEAVTGCAFSINLGVNAIEALFAVRLFQDGRTPQLPRLRGLPRLRQLGLYDGDKRVLTEEGDLFLELVKLAGLQPAGLRDKVAA